MKRSTRLMKSSLLSLAIASAMTVVWALGTISIAGAAPAGQTIPATPTPVVAAVPASSSWMLLALGGVLAIALVWGVRRMRQARQNG